MENKEKILIVLCVVLLAGALIFGADKVSAHSDAEFAAAESIISHNTPCSELNDTQLEMIGDYYMEQIHPGEQHEYMDAMMGGEGSCTNAYSNGLQILL